MNQNTGAAAFLFVMFRDKHEMRRLMLIMAAIRLGGRIARSFFKRPAADGEQRANF
jgi:hypothetical protein